jgi:hypothetical protein
VVVSGSEPEPALWSAVVASCPVARQTRAAGGSGVLAACALCLAACRTLWSLRWFAGDTLVLASLFDFDGGVPRGVRQAKCAAVAGVHDENNWICRSLSSWFAASTRAACLMWSIAT